MGAILTSIKARQDFIESQISCSVLCRVIKPGSSVRLTESWKRKRKGEKEKDGGGREEHRHSRSRHPPLAMGSGGPRGGTSSSRDVVPRAVSSAGWLFYTQYRKWKMALVPSLSQMHFSLICLNRLIASWRKRFCLIGPHVPQTKNGLTCRWEDHGGRTDTIPSTCSGDLWARCRHLAHSG